MARPIDPNEDGPIDNGGGGTTPPPSYQSGDWSKIADFQGGVTQYRVVGFQGYADTRANLNGAYQALAVNSGYITLANPAAVNPAWNNIVEATAYASPSLTTSGERWVGPFTIDMDDLTQVVANFTAPQGMYTISKKGKDRPGSVTVQLEVTPITANNTPTGPAQYFTTTISGDGTDKRPKGQTLYAGLATPGRCRIRARRLTPYNEDYSGTIVDEVTFRDAYGTAPVTQPHFGDVTTIHTRTYATSGATSVKERKLNCRATRNILRRNTDNTFGPQLVPSKDVANIICHMALDPYIGRRTLRELDVDQIYDTIAEVRQYFGFSDAGAFGYTFDEDNVSAEEMIQSVANVAFCTAYRQGNVLRLLFERETEDPVILFNHRNKQPDSETRTVKFGSLNNYDGVELDYVSAEDGAKLTLYIPEDRTAVRSKKLEITGLIDYRGDAAHPYLHAARAWYKIRYQHTTTEFTAYAEASQLVLTELIEVADNTRPDVYDGEVEDYSGLTLKLSQPFEAQPGQEYVAHLQLPSGVVQRINCTPGVDNNHVVLSQAPQEALVVDDDSWAKTTYQITPASDNGPPSWFILTQKGGYNKQTVPLQAINYDKRYYQDDKRFSP
jgi:hypothetical protein